MAPPRAEGRAEDGQPEALRRRDPQQTITVGVGPAGTGKSFLAVAMAVAALSRREVNRIVLTRPAVEAGERLGFLPGDIAAKVDPYLRPLFDALYDMLEPEKVNQHLDRGVIEVAPLAFMRGRTLNDSFIILDEAQNTSPEQIKMFLTRLGFNSKMVVTGDITQIDLPREQRSGLVVIGEILEKVEGIEFVRFGGEDVVRHKLVQRIVAAYNEYSEKQAPALREAQARRQQASPPDRDRPHRRSGGAEAPGACGAVRRGRRRRAPRHRVRRRRAHPRAEPRPPRHRRPHGRAVLSGRRGGPSAGPRELGDVVISPEHTEDLTEAVVHGVLHLCGYDHESDDGEMLSLQRRVLEEL